MGYPFRETYRAGRDPSLTPIPRKYAAIPLKTRILGFPSRWAHAKARESLFRGGGLMNGANSTGSCFSPLRAAFWIA